MVAISFLLSSQIEALYINAIQLQARAVDEIRKDEKLEIPQNINYLSFVSISYFIFENYLWFAQLFFTLQKFAELVHWRSREIGDDRTANRMFSDR